MKKLFLAASLASAIVGESYATTVSFGTLGTQRTVVNASDVPLNSTSSFWIGTFSTESFSFDSGLSITQNVANISSAGTWRQFGFDTSSGLLNDSVTSTLDITATGRLGGTITDSNSGPTKATFFDSKPLYVWVFDGATPAASTQMGIFRAPSVNSPAAPWVFPVNGVADNVTLTTNPSSVQIINAIGGAGSITPSGQLKLAASSPIPEPSTMAFGVIGAFAALFSRNRRRA